VEIKCQLDATEVFIADFHILTTMHGQNHIKFVAVTICSMYLCLKFSDTPVLKF